MENISLVKIINPKTMQLSAHGAGLLQGTAYSRLNAHLNRSLASMNISIPEWKLLGQLHEFGDVKLSMLAELLSYDPPMVTKLVKQLEKKGYVLRKADKIDERAKIITITRSGTEIVQDAEPFVKKAMAQVLDGVSREHLLIYLKVLTAIVKNTNV